MLGVFVIGRLLLRELYGLLNGFRAFFLAPMGLGRTNLRKYGSWAGKDMYSIIVDNYHLFLQWLPVLQKALEGDMH